MATPNAELHGALLGLALAQSYSCVPSPGAFSVGSVIFLPRPGACARETGSASPNTNTSTTLDKLYDLLEPSFPSFRSGGLAEDGPERDTGDYGEQVQGLILSTSYSRAIEGNTHAEANALTLLERKIAQFSTELQQDIVAATGRSTGEVSPESVYQAILSHAWMYATMEPCSRRTSGLRSCTDAILASSLKRIYIVGLGTRQSCGRLISSVLLRECKNRRIMCNVKGSGCSSKVVST